MCAREVFVLSVLLIGFASPSAIPMWEFLSRGEKMSHLFNMFVKQVASHCDTSTMPDCQKVLLVYGLTNLAKMEDDSLDQMDPYQRGATDIIWESMMKGGYKSSGQEENVKDEYDPLEPHTNGNQLGSQEEASSNVEEYAAPNRHVMGPMVVRVLPDGRPVPGDAQRPLPADEDAEEFLAMRAKPIPSISDISNARHQRIQPAKKL
ncbi:rhythmically expressed gene 5 protein [Nilaparvata lugens]|uniref:rhythmically expressed gene 5 protein n=1 Tax=Nilaparvata lugens TaxID=108931 RepID=UPI000B9842DE|nr:rhythmically expressed gene 5 protein [Nilaparvata lugens]